MSLNAIDYESTFDAATFVKADAELPGDKEIARGTSALIVFNFDGVIDPNDPRIIQFEEQNKRHGRWLTALVGVGSKRFFAAIVCSIIMLFLG